MCKQPSRVIAVIPARMGSSRFPGKPLALLRGQPMIAHVLRRAEMAKGIEAVYVATCDDEIKSAVEELGGKVIMTSPAHERASDRTAEAAEQIEKVEHVGSDIVVMIQGDEPMITAEMIEAAVAPMLLDPIIPCVNLVRRISRREELNDTNTIKVVKDAQGDALYFSRSPIPFDLSAEQNATVFKQVCVIPFRVEFLRQFARLKPTPLERAESIDMLRALEHGYKVRLVETATDTHAVDTPEDLLLVQALMST